MRPFYHFSWRVVRALFRALLGFKAVGSESVPSTGRIILASNHRSYLDPPLIGVSVRREVHFLAKSELFVFAPFARIISALNAHPVRRGKKDTGAIGVMTDLLKDDMAVVIFPEGTRQKKGAVPGKAKSGIARLALASGAPILPVYIKGSQSVWKAILRIEPVRVYFGRVISPEEAGRYRKDATGYRALAGHVLEEINGLIKEMEAERRNSA